MIGMFDSGSGGLTVLRALREKTKNADIIYFGDIAHAPYGEKTANELRRLTIAGLRLLHTRGATVLVSACNSVSTSVLAGAAETMPYIEMSRPTARFMQDHRGKRYLLIATPATIGAGLYQRVLDGIVDLDPLPIAGLAGAIEFGESEEPITRLLNDAFSSRRGEQYDGLILGCTHYPLIRERIMRIARDYCGEMDIIDPAYAVADEVCATFNTGGSGKTILLISKESAHFRERVDALFGSDCEVEVV